MNQAFDPTSVRLTLRKGIEKGYWTLEDLDTPSMGWKENAERFQRNYPKYQQPLYRNLLRDTEAAATVSLSDPRDFTPAPGHTPALDPPAPLSPPSDDHRPPAPTQPVSVTDDPVDPEGITVYTNADDPDLWF